MEVAEPAHGDVEGGNAALDHPAVEHDGGVRATLVGGDPVDDRVAADLLFAVAGESDVDGELARCGETLGGLQQHVQLPLVVGDAAGVEPAVALHELERRRLPLIERVGGLHVEVPVAEDGRGALGARRGLHLADHERPLAPRHHVGLAAHRTHPGRHPLRRFRDVALVCGVGADGGDRDQLRELRQELVELISQGCLPCSLGRLPLVRSAARRQCSRRPSAARAEPNGSDASDASLRVAKPTTRSPPRTGSARWRQRGMLPCLRLGPGSRLVRVVLSALIRTGRVRRGSMTSST